MNTTTLQSPTFTATPITSVFDEYGTFEPSLYFAVLHELIPSELSISLELKGSWNSYLELVDKLAIHQHDRQIMTRGWTLPKKNKDSDGKSYPSEIFYVSESEPLCIGVDMYKEATTVKFFFDYAHPGLEKRLLRLAEQLRDEYLIEEKPTFKVLSVNGMSFTTQEIEIKPLHINIERHYNDDFAPVDKVIRASIDEQRSGLILLHGLPGTGKTSYIKHLIATNPEQELIFIPNDFVEQMLQPGFISFLLTKKDSILVIEDAEKVIMSRNDSGQNSVVSTILQITDGLFSDFLNIKVVCTFNTDVSRIDKALFRKGRMIAFYEFGELSEDKARAVLAEGAAMPRTRTLAEIFNAATDNFAESADNKRIGFNR